MNSRLFFYALLCFTFIACGKKEKKAETKITPATDTNVSNTTTATPKEKSSESDKKLALKDKIKIIKTNFSTIEQQLSSLEKKEVEEFVGGGVIKKEAYFERGIPKKVKSGNYGEHGSIVHTFYLKDDKLFFVFQEEFSEAGMRGPFTKKETRYYIFGDKLIRVLEKEKTSKLYEFDMSTSQNVDVTASWTSKTDAVSEFNKTLRETSTSLLETQVVGLDNGRWINTDDPKSGVEIKDGKFIMFYKGTETSPNSIFKYTLTEKDGVEYLNLENDIGDKMIYGLLEYSDESMVLSYLNRGSTLTYRKEK